jgi:septal ring factor EnvC (AmiA/AmiB activator)
MRGFLLLAVLAAATSGCAEKVAEHRVRAALVNAGVSEDDADCMARRMVDRLTIAQLRRLEALRGEKRSLADYVGAVQRVGDSEAIAVTVSSAALCATGLAH